jgi:hypothetical protein
MIDIGKAYEWEWPVPSTFQRNVPWPSNAGDSSGELFD